MNLTTKSEYALLGLFYLAIHKDEFVTVDDIVDHYEIPKKYLEKILTILKQNRFIKTRRGPSGGYKINKKPEEISLAEIIRLMDGALSPTESVSKYFYTETPLSREVKFLEIMQEIRDFISNKLEKTTLQNLI